MAQILYKARNSTGVETAGFVDATTAQEAVAKLKASGLTDIELHESPGIGVRDEACRAALTDDQAAQMAAFHLRIRKKPGLQTLLREVARRQRLWIAAYLGLIVVGLAFGRPWLAVSGTVLLALTFGPPAWSHRFSRRFDRMICAMQLGEWDEAARMLALFRQRKHPEAIEVSIHFYDAQIRVRRGEALQAALARLEAMRSRVSVEMFPARLAAVHTAAKDYDGYLACMCAAWEFTPTDPSRTVDYALGLARFGDLVKSEQLLDSIDMQALQVNGRPFVAWARGLVALRNGKPTAQASLLQGVEGFLQIASPSSWSSLALCSGACALALQRNGDTAGAKTMIGRVWPVLKVCADTRLRAEIDKEIGTP